MPYRKYKFGCRLRRHIEDCSECGHKFEEGENVWSKFTVNYSGHKVTQHLCDQCYQGKFVDVS